MIETCTLRLDTAEKTILAGKSLANTLYTKEIDIFLSGELGAGKTTFVQGFGEACGCTERLTSPTFALEKHYQTAWDIPLLHIDLYRLNEEQAKSLLADTDDVSGIRCIEWPLNAGEYNSNRPAIHITLEEEGNGRLLTCTFDDVPVPSEELIHEWRKEVLLPEHIVRHCEKVADTSMQTAELLCTHNVLARKKLVGIAGQLHDLLRFVDFKDGAAPATVQHSAEEKQHWKDVATQYPNMHHEEACAHKMRKEGYDALGEIITVHGVNVPLSARTTIEQKILYYADKRTMVDKAVSLDERFADFQKRYGNNPNATLWINDAKHVEAELFPDGAPRLS